MQGCGLSYPAGAGQRGVPVFIDIVSLVVYFFIAAVRWLGATTREFEPLCVLLNALAIAKITKRANDYEQS